MLHDRGVLVIPDFIANAGGVICAAMEYRGATQSAAFAAIEERTRANTRAVLEAVTAKRALPREAALDLASERIRQAMSYRRFSIF
jgi:glutamate dehydrogenase (NAD(P)+)